MSGKIPENALVQEYGILAPEYDTRWSFYVAATAQRTLARLEAYAGERILDVGCGTGVLLAELARTNPTLILTGIDPVKEMLDVARARLPGSPTLKQGWAEALPFPDHSFDKVLSCNMFHYITQPLRALAEMMRVLVPGGTLVLTDWCNDYVTCKLNDLYLRLGNQAHYRTHGSHDLKAMLEHSGFSRVKVERYKIDWRWGMMTAQACKD